MTAALAVLVVSTLTSSNAAQDSLGIVMSASPSGAVTNAVGMRIAAEATEGSIPIFLREAKDTTLYGVGFSATPLVDQKGVGSVTPTLDPNMRTLPRGGDPKRVDAKVSELKALGTFTSTLYATLGNRTQTLGTLTVVHTLRTDELQIAAIDSAKSIQQFPGGSSHLTLLVTIQNTGDADASFSAPVIADLASKGNTASQADMPTLVVSEQDGKPPSGTFAVAAGGETTLRLLLEHLKRTGTFTGTLRVAAAGHEPVEQSFAFTVKQGAAFPAIVIALGVVIAYGIRRRYSSGRIGRAGQRRLVERLRSDVSAARANVHHLEPREALILETLERRLVDVSDELELARASKKTGVLSEVDHKIDLFLDFVVARTYVRAMTPDTLQEPFEARLNEAASFLAEAKPSRDLEARLTGASSAITEMPKAVEAAVRERLQHDVDRFLAVVDTSPAASEALPLRVLDRISSGRQLADGGRFGEARAELAAAQLVFARILAEHLAARIPDADSGPPGFVSGWPRFRAATVEGLKVVRRERRGERAADAYRAAWQDYVIELATRLKSTAARERRGATGSRKQQLTQIVEACDDAATKALDLDPAAVDAYRRAVEGYLAPAGLKRSSSRIRSLLEDAELPPPMTVVAGGLEDAERLPRPSVGGAQSAASLTKQIRKRHVSIALVAAAAAIPAGLALLWAPNDTWGTFTDGAAVFGWGFGLQALTAMLDARRLGWTVSRRAVSAPQRRAGSSVMRPEREPAS